MKKIFLIVVISMLAISQKVYAQTDSIQEKSKSYKRNIQCFLRANISLYYEQALNKHTSLKFRASYQPLGHMPFRESWKNSQVILLSTQYRYYFNKNKSYNEGFYLNGTILFLYEHSFEDCYYDNSINKIYIRDNDYMPTPTAFIDDVYYEKINGYVGLGFGYQWIFGKRIVMDLGITPCLPLLNIERFRHTENNQQWRNTIYGESVSWWTKAGGRLI